jgi:hypothetical protein
MLVVDLGEGSGVALAGNRGQAALASGCRIGTGLTSV